MCLSGSLAADKLPFSFSELRFVTLAYCLSHVGMGQRSYNVATWRRVGLWVGAEWQVGCRVGEDSAGGNAGRGREGGLWGGCAHGGAPPQDGRLIKGRNYPLRRCRLFPRCVFRHLQQRNHVRRRRHRAACAEARRRCPGWRRSSRRRRFRRPQLCHRRGRRRVRRCRLVLRCGHRAASGVGRRKGPCSSPLLSPPRRQPLVLPPCSKPTRPRAPSPLFWCAELGHRRAPGGAAAGSSFVGTGGETTKCSPVPPCARQPSCPGRRVLPSGRRTLSMAGAPHTGSAARLAAAGGGGATPTVHPSHPGSGRRPGAWRSFGGAERLNQRRCPFLEGAVRGEDQSRGGAWAGPAGEPGGRAAPPGDADRAEVWG